MEQNNDEKNYEENKKKFKMSLLYIQTKELKNFYISKMEKEPKSYYLIDKEWLDNYKSRNNYENYIDILKGFNDWKDYSDFKNKISNKFKLEKNRLTTFKVEDQIDNYFNFSLQKGKINNSHLNYPQNCELIKKEFVEDVSDGSSGFILYDIYIGNNLILINDCETQNVAFLCTLVENEENKKNFLIQINYLLAFESEKYMKEEFDQIIDEKYLNDYFSKRKIDISKKGEQNLINKNGKKIGKIFIINSKNENINHQNNNNNNINVNNNNNINNAQLPLQLNENQNKDSVNNQIININNNNSNNNSKDIDNQNDNINNKKENAISQTCINQKKYDLNDSLEFLQSKIPNINDDILKNSNQNESKTSITNVNAKSNQSYRNNGNNIQDQNMHSSTSILRKSNINNNNNNINSTFINNSFGDSKNINKSNISLRASYSLGCNNNYSQMMTTNINNNNNNSMNNNNNFMNNIFARNMNNNINITNNKNEVLECIF